jgi:hypothetical protein
MSSDIFGASQNDDDEEIRPNYSSEVGSDVVATAYCEKVTIHDFCPDNKAEKMSRM